MGNKSRIYCSKECYKVTLRQKRKGNLNADTRSKVIAILRRKLLPVIFLKDVLEDKVNIGELKNIWNFAEIKDIIKSTKEYEEYNSVKGDKRVGKKKVLHRACYTSRSKAIAKLQRKLLPIQLLRDILENKIDIGELKNTWNFAEIKDVIKPAKEYEI